MQSHPSHLIFMCWLVSIQDFLGLINLHGQIFTTSLVGMIQHHHFTMSLPNRFLTHGFNFCIYPKYVHGLISAHGFFIGKPAM